MKQSHFDALVVGAGFGGIYQLHKFVKLGLNTKLIEMAADVGGTWYHNRYPGAMSDSYSMVYRYSWDKDDLVTYPWKNRYVHQPEVLKYLQHVVERHDLRRYMQFNTELTRANYDEVHNRWVVQTSTGDVYTVRYLVTALGILSRINYPDIPGLKSFKGEMYHTGKWPKAHEFRDKRVGVIGNGSTGVQVITALGPEVKSLTSFQRRPQYSVPSGNRALTKEERDDINARYDEIWEFVRNSTMGVGLPEGSRPTMSVSAEEREQVFEDAWQGGNGFRFMFSTFNDIITSEEANEEACKFLRRKIKDTVKDPEKARKLTPTEIFARRPICDSGYFEQFNRSNVDLALLSENPIQTITEKGVLMQDGTHYDLDVLIFATGFDAVDGNWTRTTIKGRGGKSLKEHWDKSGSPTSLLGSFVPDFPNMFMLFGPSSPFGNGPPVLEAQVDFIIDVVQQAEKTSKKQTDSSTTNGVADGALTSRGPVVEALPSSVDAWVQKCESVANGTLFPRLDNWILGKNVPGKTPSVLVWLGGIGQFRKYLQEIAEGGYQTFEPFS
ncbi:uncharacterized protein PV06_05227 [Exophiala oligosperma]|uniref:FAD/NAD(P)-binding domain-containing protein n=1 Tax=Exophiala oligosperma TaxID=215243 RepID=A0A0D2E8K1_9EURO|nr:uncharacterized protein PV06_05227 [Exophiala oligosperma]KIW44199.1 hypothetical protein PV06_05227 [Exophiala oligosperma]